ncbi:MAG: aspartate carbamoyltransferase [Oscillospiraceae bacterium]|nr:aspartate carbamoyltransferase [Oscillospiraceae bacterium]
MLMRAKSLISTLDFTVEEQDDILSLAGRIAAAPGDYGHLMGGRIMASLFFEPSTRTRLSFETAMLRLGGQVIGFSESASSSAAKGESLSDTIRTIDKYADLIVIRHPKEGAARVAAENTSMPVINAGDGGREHPTQTLTDLMTIRQAKRRLDNLVIGCAGDLKFGRTIHSLARNIGRYKNVSFIFVSPEELRIPTFLRAHLDAEGIRYEETADMERSIGGMDVLYMTRVQRERFFNEQDYIRLKDVYILDTHKMRLAKPDLAVLHPLPRVNEIAYEIDRDPRALYFEQAGWGLYARMALIAKMLGGAV